MATFRVKTVNPNGGAETLRITADDADMAQYETHVQFPNYRIFRITREDDTAVEPDEV
jgi:hypothetical protein